MSKFVFVYHAPTTPAGGCEIEVHEALAVPGR